MADTIERIVKVDVADAVEHLEEMREASEEAGYSFKSLAEAKKYIDRLKASLIDIDSESDEYVETVKEIEKVQSKLNEAMKASSSSLKNADGSYNALSKRMSELKKAWKETNDEAERQSLGKEIVSINEQLKAFDASIGNYQRNVGNYEGAFTKGLAGISEKIESLGNPLAIAKNGVLSLGKAFKALIMNPVGAVITAIVVAINALKKGFEGSETATNNLKRAFSAFQPVINAVQNVFTGFANIVGNIAVKAIPALVNSLQKAGTWMMTLLNKVGAVSDEKLESFKKSIEAQKAAVETTQNLTEREIALTERRRKFLVEEAKDELKISELKAKAADKDKYTDEERIKFLESSIAIERKLNKERLDQAQEEFDMLKAKAELTDNTAEDNERLAQAEANLYNIRSQYYEKERGLVKQLSEARKSLSKDEEDAVKAAAKNTEALNKEKEKELAKVKEINERTSLALLSSTDKDLAILTKKYNEEKVLLEKYGEDTVKLTAEYERRKAEIKASEGETKLKNIDSETALEALIADKTIQIEHNKNMRLLEIERKRLEDQKVIYEELYNLDNISVEKKEEYKNKLIEINAQLVDNSEKRKREEKNHIQETISNYAQLAQSVGNLMGEITAIWQDSIDQRVKNGEITEEQAKKEFEDSKKLQIATAVINGLAGVAMAVSTAMSLGPILGPIMAAVNSATVIASTAAQIAKIKQTTFDGAGGGNTAKVTTVTPTNTATSYTPRYSTNITGQSETTNLANAVKEGQGDTKVYVLESDIAESGKKVTIRESEATF